MNPPLPTFDMMTGQQVIQGSVMPPETAAMIVNESDVVHVQLLDRMVVVPSAIINGPTLRHYVTCPSGQTPHSQHGQAYLLFVTWKNFKPLLEYLSGNPAQLPSDKTDLLELKQTARKFNAKEFERLVNRHLKQLHGGGCMGTSCFGMSSKQISAHDSVPPQQTPPAVPAPMQPALQAEQPSPVRTQLTPFRAQQLHQSKAQPALATLKLAPIKTKPAAKRGFFSRIRPARHPRAEKAYDTKENSVYVAANAQEQPQVVYDLQRPLIV